MEYDNYVVAPGDTLSRIAQAHGTDSDKLASLNGISEPNYIYPGQKLKIPKQPVPQEDSDDDFYSELWIRFVDAVGKPIVDLATRVVTASGEYHFTTDDMGFIPPVQTQEQDDKPHIFVSKMGGGEKKVATLKSHPGVHQHTLRSPKIKISVPLRKHDGLPDHDPGKPVKLEPGEVQHNRDLDGHPVINVGVECPNNENLRLGPNSKYREFLIISAQRSGLIPQGIAAFSNAEALTIKIAKTMDVKGKGGVIKKKTLHVNTGEWDPTSAAPGSSGLGLTQFLNGTWLMLAKDKSSFLHKKISEAESSGKKMPSSEILALRLDPELSIVSAGDYAKMNLATLERMGVLTTDLRPTEMAKAAYFCHHEGAGGAVQIVKGTLSDSEAESKLAKQLKKKGSTGVPEAEAYMEKVKLRGLAAYKKWLFDYIDSKITPMLFACDPDKLTPPRSMAEVSWAMSKNKGK